MKSKSLSTLGGLALVTGLTLAANANAAVTIYGVASSSGPFITVQAYADITDPPIVSYSLKMFYDSKLLEVASASRNDEVWFLGDGTRRVPYLEPDVSRPGEVLFLGAKMDSSQPLEGVTGSAILLGTTVFSRLSSETPTFEVSLGRQGAYASFVTSTGTTLDAVPGAVKWSRVSPTREDQDLDGLSDLWEIEHFKDLRAAFYSDDPDRDGVNNQGEEALGSDPNDAQSNLRLNIVRQSDAVLLHWTSFPDRFYAIEMGDDLGRFRPFETGIKATPPQNDYKLKLPQGAGATFYRVRLETSPQR
jgi:hypothetical protein